MIKIEIDDFRFKNGVLHDVVNLQISMNQTDAVKTINAKSKSKFKFNRNLRFQCVVHNFTFQAISNGYPKIWLSLGVTFGICLIAFTALVLSLKTKKSQFGEARFANNNEIKQMKLFNDKGIIIGKYKGKFLRFGGQQFVALGAPTRSGKGVGIVIPNLLEWVESAVVQDIKQECFD